MIGTKVLLRPIPIALCRTINVLLRHFHGQQPNKNQSMKENMHPESLMMSHGYKPELSEGSIKCPIFQTSTFVFKNAQEGKAFFEVAYGKREQQPNEELGFCGKP